MTNKISLGSFVNPIDLVISQIKDLISSGNVKPGEKLPPERKLAEQLGVSRSQIREAINKLQIHGIVKVQPQSGTVVTGIGRVAVQGLITNFLQLEKEDFESLVDTRILLEKESARLAALNRTDNDLIQLNKAVQVCENKLNQGEDAIEEDLLIHLKIAESSKNNVLKSIMSMIIPHIGNSYVELNFCDDEKNRKIVTEHRLIVDAIINQDPTKASDLMEAHFQDVKQFSRDIRIERDPSQ